MLPNVAARAVVRLLVDKSNVEADSKDNGGRSPLSFAAGGKIQYNPNGRNETVVQLLIEREDVEADSRDKDGRSPLFICCRIVATMHCTTACG